MRLGAVLLVCSLVVLPAARADETCQSPYMAKIEGEEEFVYVWTLGMEGVGVVEESLCADLPGGGPTLWRSGRSE